MQKIAKNQNSQKYTKILIRAYKVIKTRHSSQYYSSLVISVMKQNNEKISLVELRATHKNLHMGNENQFSHKTPNKISITWRKLEHPR